MRKPLAVLIAVLVVIGGFAPMAVAGSSTGSVPTAQSTSDCEYPLTVTDATGTEVTLEEPPERIVALQPSDTKIVYGIGAEDRLVGMPINEYTASHDPGDRTDISIPDELHIDVETVIDLEPDIVLAADVTLEEDVEQLRDAGITVYHFKTATSLDDVRDITTRTGELTGECGGAEERIDWMDERLEVIETALEGEDRPLAFWSLGFGYTAGANTFQDEVLTTAGVDNLAAEVGLEGWPEISDEVVVEEDPDWIIYGVNEEGEDPALSEGAMQTTAYENDQLVAVDANTINQPAPDVVYAIETIVEAVHPEAYAEIEAELEGGIDADDEQTDDDQSNESEADSDAETDDDERDEENETADDGESEDSIPGFGVPAALAALVCLLGLRRL
ncbi:PGF-CTERM-anchored ABC transporter substrate-binding protein [Natronosalvus caseinilyticus]|uniref:PGF-CTERM-anchored ABC transporter substrate-binding protein n=1 Tax=Natronosalvus caseinilyticus TaxID=2953747 RepID=UPI0028AFA113|nr:PGF-CTERM-anchored ABC transporter substrate-binding protein [Natronosalvus caseinilyticus]